jgi:hypothetical protein
MGDPTQLGVVVRIGGLARFALYGSTTTSATDAKSDASASRIAWRILIGTCSQITYASKASLERRGSS